MSTVSVELPAELAAELGGCDRSGKGLSENVVQAIAIELFHRQKLSAVRAAELLSMNAEEFQELILGRVPRPGTRVAGVGFDWRKVKGKYAHLRITTEAFLKEKKEEIARECD